MSKSPPGVMFYFDTTIPALELLSDEEAGRLFRSTLDYSRFGVVPDFSDCVALGMAWRFIQPKVDSDKVSYRNKCIQNKHKVYCRECKKKGIPAMEFDEWLRMVSLDNNEEQQISADNHRHLTTEVTLTPKVTLAPEVTPTIEGSPSEGSDTALFGLLDDGPGFDTLRSEAIKLLEGYR